MPTKGEDTTAKEVLYPDDLAGRTLELDPDRELNGGMAYWAAEDTADAERLPDGAKRGWWLPVDCADDGRLWMAVPRALREELNSLQSGDIVEIVRCEKGPGDTDPYSVEVAVVTTG